MREYWKKIYDTRFFWSHLAKNDLKFKFRGSKLGLIWAVIQPLFLTIILSVVFSVVFKQPMGEYSLYVLSGIVVWDSVQACVVGGGNCLFMSVQYIRQFNHPVSIYTLRYSISMIATFCMEMIALVAWVLFSKPGNLVVGIITLPLTIVLYFILFWGLVTIAGYSGTKYRDYSQIMVLVMQMIYYVSPVFFKQEMFMSSDVLRKLFMLNPITHLLNLVRSPFVYMAFPSKLDYLFVVFTDAIVVLAAVLVNKKNEKKVIFYL